MPENKKSETMMQRKMATAYQPANHAKADGWAVFFTRLRKVLMLAQETLDDFDNAMVPIRQVVADPSNSDFPSPPSMPEPQNRWNVNPSL